MIMARRYYNLPSLTMLDTFEAAARLGSFKQAARELNVTPGAVSHQIRALEAELQLALFRRSHRAVTLSPEGRVLYTTLEGSFSTLSHTLQKLRRSRDAQSVTIGTTSAISALWLTPRITRFWQEHGDITINQQVSDSPVPGPQLLDMMIKYGKYDSEPRADLLFHDDLVPLCSPAYASACGQVDLPDLAQCRLIHSDARDHDWTTWISWFGALGYSGPVRTGLRVNNYTIALQTAQDSGGVVLGWRQLVRPLLRSGALVALGSFSSPAPGAFYLVTSEVTLSAGAAMFRNWLRKHTHEINSSQTEDFKR
jgi:LysR family transcriptional regulator, glycine cleavage system transcriptional activator